jgi:hypothetical protein
MLAFLVGSRQNGAAFGAIALKDRITRSYRAILARFLAG